MKLNSVITLDNSQFNRAAASSRGQVGALGGGIARTLAPMAAFAGGFLSAAGAMLAFNKAKNEAAEFEDFEASFVTLLGSQEAAMQRMQELSDFGKSTPFELPGVVKASKVLESLTQGALSTGPGLTMVGDVAASAGQPVEELAVHIGRLYDGLQTGRAVGESLARLQELGLISGEARGEIEKLQKEGAAGEQVWGVAQTALGRFSGEMDRRSKTWNGMMSNFKDGVDAVHRAFGTPVIDALKPALAAAIGQTGDLEASAERFGNKVAGGIRLISAAFEDNSAGGLFVQGLLVAGAKFLNQISLGWEGIIRGGLSAWLAGFKNSIALFKDGITKAGLAIKALLLTAVAEVIDAIPNADASVAQAKATAARTESMNFRGEGTITGLPQLLMDAFQNGMADASGILQIDTAGLERELQGSVDYLRGILPDIEKAGFKAFDPKTLFGMGPNKEGFLGGLDSFRSALLGDASTAPAATSPAQALGNATAGIQQVAADRLARIGGFVGGTSPATNHARQTADNTKKQIGLIEKTNNYLQTLAERTTTAGGSAAWA